MTDRLTFIPEQAGYGVAHPNQVIAVELDGGAPRLRADRIRASGSVSAAWLLSAVEYTQFMQFIRDSTLRGALPFLVDLVTDDHLLARHRATLTPGSLRTSRVNGLTYEVTAELRPEQLISWVGSFFATAPNVVATATPVSLNGVLANPAVVQVLGLSPGGLDLDGIYGISSFPTGNSIALVSPAGVNPNWSSVVGTTATVANVMLINSPT